MPKTFLRNRVFRFVTPVSTFRMYRFVLKIIGLINNWLIAYIYIVIYIKILTK